MLPLPWPDASFTHRHLALRVPSLPRPAAPCCARWRGSAAPGGTVMVVDSAPAPDKADAFNRMEVLRDPSHARALPLDEHLELFRAGRSARAACDDYRLEGELESLIARSFPQPRRRRHDPRDLPRLARRRRARHPGPPGRRHDPLRLSGGRARRPTELRTTMRIVDLSVPDPAALPLEGGADAAQLARARRHLLSPRS